MQPANATYLVQQTLKGDKSAFQKLYDAHKRLLFSICLRYTSNRASAEDMLQEAFISIFRNLEKYDGNKGAFASWSKKIVINTCLQELRKKSLYSISLSQSEDVPFIGADAIANLGVQELTAIIQTIPPGYQAVFNMYVIDGFTHKEIAETLNISISTSKTQLMKARILLQKKVSSRRALNQEHG